MKQPKASTQKVKDRVEHRKIEPNDRAPKPGDNLEQIRRTLGWGLIEHYRGKKRRGK